MTSIEYLGSKLRDERKRQGRSLSDISKLTGINVSTLSRFERGERNSLSTFLAYAACVGIQSGHIKRAGWAEVGIINLEGNHGE